MPSHWAKAHESRVIWSQLGEATPPHLYKLLALYAGPLHHRQEIFCLY